jgi:ABC transport system ATP-binding/permease protein
MSKSFGDRVIVDKLDLLIMRGDRLGIVGPNGAGKTTLIKLITGELSPDTGSVRLGTGLQTVMLDQSRQSLDPNSTLADVITDGRGETVTINGETRHVVSYMKDFLFRPEQARTPVSVLSGGERARLILARELAKPSNLLVLDEPTNDLDLETLDVLQEMLDAYAGTVLLISHDRDFLDRIVERVIVPEGNGKWRVYAGGYSDMLTQRGAEIVLDKPKPAKTESPESDRPASSPAVSARRKLTLQQINQLDSLPSAMEKLRVVIGKLQARLDDPELYARDRKTFDETMALLEKAHAELGKMEERWLELEILREEAAAG